MRKLHCAAVVVLSACAAAAAAGPDQVRRWKLVEEVTYDWRGDSNPYEFVMRIPEDHEAGGYFTQLRIFRGGREIFQLTDDDGLAKVKEALSFPEIVEASSQNLLKSEYLLMLPGLKGRSTDPVLMLFGWGYGSSPGSLHVIALDSTGIPKGILRLTNFDLWSITDLDHDGVPELIGRKCLTQEWGPGFLTYDPVLVYRFGAGPDSPMTLDTALSQRYNEEHLYGWAGSECSEDLAVVLHPPGGGSPRIMPAKEAEALFK